MPHKSGFISIIGNPNVGKSTLINAMMGVDLSIITPKAQTTRHRILGLINGDHYQLVISDTPGIIKPAYEMQTAMMDFVKESLDDADVLMYMAALGETKIKDQRLFKRISETQTPLLVLLNKMDLSNQDELNKAVIHWEALLPNAKVYPISALTQFFVPELLKLLIELVPESPPYFPKDQITDKPERFFVNEAIREAILNHYTKEIPYAVEVTTESFIEEAKIIKIQSVILVERDTQKGILIGHKGSKLKQVGSTARVALEQFFGKKIYLELFVKVAKNWRSNPQQLRRFGYQK
ncbi:MAG TPA: GTPase Era [Flavobacteriaceae bacterium]|nr:GTPase Era [Flavobacteriaceae bacterium]